MDGIPKGLTEKEMKFNHYICRGKNADGEGVIVYVLDTGYNLQNEAIGGEQIEFPQAFTDEELSPTYFGITQNERADREQEELLNQSHAMDESLTYHGTRVAAYIAAKGYGSASKCLLAPVRFNKSAVKKNRARGTNKSKDDLTAKPVIEDCIACCRKILAHYRKVHRRRPAILNCSFCMIDKTVKEEFETSKIKDERRQPAERASELIISLGKEMKALVEEGMIVIVAAGNRNVSINYSWTKWLDSKHHRFKGLEIPSCYPNVITVGALNRDGLKWKRSNWGENVIYWLLSHKLKDPLDPKLENLRSGTSFAAPLLSGIIACFLSSAKYGKHIQTFKGEERQKEVRRILDQVAFKCLIEGNIARVFRDAVVPIDDLPIFISDTTKSKLA